MTCAVRLGSAPAASPTVRPRSYFLNQVKEGNLPAYVLTGLSKDGDHIKLTKWIEDLASFLSDSPCAEQAEHRVQKVMRDRIKCVRTLVYEAAHNSSRFLAMSVLASGRLERTKKTWKPQTLPTAKRQIRL